MDLNMIKGLGRTYQQILLKNNISDIEQLIRLLPSNIHFLELKNLEEIKETSIITIEGVIISNIEVSDEGMLKFKVKSKDEITDCFIKKSNYIRKQLLTGSQLKFHGLYNVIDNEFEIHNVYDIFEKNYDLSYEIYDIQSSLIQKFILNGISILENYSNELPAYIREKKNINEYSDILKKIHSPKLTEDFYEGLNLYTYEIFFNILTKYYYYILTTSLERNEENYEIQRIISVKDDFQEQFSEDVKKKINFLLKECKKNSYSNIIVEGMKEDKFLVTLMLIVAKISIKKQVVIITDNEYEFYSQFKQILIKYGIKTELMSKKGKNKDNFNNFNSGKFDVLLTTNVNFENLNTNKIGLVIIDDEKFDISKRYKINCKNTDTIFYTKTNFGVNFNEKIFKNITIYSEETSENLKNILNAFCTNETTKILLNLLNENSLQDILTEASIDAFDFIKNKKFKENKENSLYFKKNIEK